MFVDGKVMSIIFIYSVTFCGKPHSTIWTFYNGFQILQIIIVGCRVSCPIAAVEAAIQEDVDVVGLSILSGAHMTIFPKILRMLKAKKSADIIVVGGGIIPVDDMKKLERMGIRKLFGPGTPTSEIVEWIKTNTGKPKRITVRQKPRKKVRKKSKKR